MAGIYVLFGVFGQSSPYTPYGNTNGLGLYMVMQTRPYHPASEEEIFQLDRPALHGSLGDQNVRVRIGEYLTAFMNNSPIKHLRGSICQVTQCHREVGTASEKGAQVYPLVADSLMQL